MFEENKNPVTEVTENVEEQATEELVDGVVDEEVEDTENSTEETTEEAPKLYSEEEFNERLNELLARKIARKEAKIRKEYESKYGRAETILKTGLGKENFDEAVSELENFYTEKGIKIPDTPHYSERERKILAEAEANEIISLGYKDIKEEVDRLASIGVDKMTPEEKIIFNKLAQERKTIEDEQSLASIGVKKVDDEFKKFSKKLNPNLSMKEKYEMYLKLNPKQKGEPIGSMKNGQTNRTKDYYTADEIKKLSLDDLSNPKVWDAVRKSMTSPK